MEKERPYWKVAVSLLLSVGATILFVTAGIKLIGYFMPFVIGWLISVIAHPLVCWLEKRLKIKKKFGSALVIVLVLGGIVLAAYFGITKLVQEIANFSDNFPQMYSELEQGIHDIGEKLHGMIEILPDAIRKGGNAVLANIDEWIGKLIQKISTPTVAAAGNVAKKIPSLLIGIIVAIMSAYFFIAQRDEVIAWCNKAAPVSVRKRMKLVNQNLHTAVGGYFKAQFKIMIVVAVILFAGLSILHVKYAILLAIFISFIDMLPVFGTGTIMIPWFIYKLLIGDYKYAVGLVVLYATTQIVRQVIQPKLVGDSMGLNPIVTLFFLYIGYKVGSVLGLLVAVPIGMILLNMYQAGAFDYILDDAKILLKGILSLRGDGKQ